MKVLTSVDANRLLESDDFDSFISRLAARLVFVEGAYAKPTSAGLLIALSKLFAYRLVQDAPVCIYVTAWGIAAEIPDLFYGYRRSIGDSRPLIEAPVHWFEQNEEEALVSVLFMIFAFCWDAWIFDISGRTLIKVSHDGWLEIRANEQEAVRDIAFDMHEYGVPLLNHK